MVSFMVPPSLAPQWSNNLFRVVKRAPVIPRDEEEYIGGPRVPPSGCAVVLLRRFLPSPGASDPAPSVTFGLLHSLSILRLGRVRFPGKVEARQDCFLPRNAVGSPTRGVR